MTPSEGPGCSRECTGIRRSGQSSPRIRLGQDNIILEQAKQEKLRWDEEEKRQIDEGNKQRQRTSQEKKRAAKEERMRLRRERQFKKLLEKEMKYQKKYNRRRPKSRARDEASPYERKVEYAEYRITPWSERLANWFYRFCCKLYCCCTFILVCGVIIIVII